jgi:hypothetical protein
MSLVKLSILIFIIIETGSVLTLYFNPAFKYGNGLGVFKAFEKSKEIEDVHKLIRYLANWVANVKVIVIFTAAVIINIASEQVQLYYAIAMAISFLFYFITMYPIIAKMDKQNKLTIKRYSLIISGVVLALIVFYAVSILIAV